MEIRLATPADAAAVAALAARLFYQSYSDSHQINDLDQYVSEHFPELQVQAELAKPTSAWFVVHDAMELVGYAELRSRETPPETGDRPALELGRFYLDARWHGQGLARQLLDAVIDQAGHRGAEVLWLVVWAQNERAKAFYRKHGFRKVGTAPYKIGGKIYDDDLMLLTLA